MTKLKIKPEFRDLIPKLTDEEFKMLEENILADGEVREPIIVWNGYIVDGHHRWYVIQKHPDIPYSIKEMDFKNEHAAMAWACANQLGRRNLPNADRDYLIGTQYAHEKMAHGGDRKSAKAKSNCSKDSLIQEGETAVRVAKEHGVLTREVYKDAQFAKGVDIADEIKPGMKDDILQGNINVTKKVMRKIPMAEPEVQAKAVELISEGEAHRAETILDGDGSIIAGMYDTGKESTFTETDLIQEMSFSFKEYMESMDNMLEEHADILDDADARERIYDTYIGLLKGKLSDLEEEKQHGRI